MADLNYKTTKLNAALRNSVWNTYIGVEAGTSVCYCCGLEPISRANFACGHVISRNQGGPDTVPNLRPVCVACNSSMGTKNMKAFALENGFKGKITTEKDPEPTVQSVIVGLEALPMPSEAKEVAFVGKFPCVLCKKPFTHATLNKYDGEHCFRCFKLTFDQKPQVLKLVKVLPHEEGLPCGHCGGLNKVIEA
jgi:hypothetical protein